MRKRSILLLTGALAIAASLVIGPAATAGPSGPSAGTVVFIHDQEPPNLNNDLANNGLYATSLVMNNILLGGGIWNARAQLQPALLQQLPQIVRRSPLTVRIQYKQNAVWSDGRPVTGQDFRTKWQTIINPQFDIRSRSGYEDIRSVAVRGKTATIVFRRPYALWRELAAGAPFPTHKVRGQNFNQLWLNGIDVSSGPWRFQSWQRGQQITVVKNARYRATRQMVLDRVVFRYILDTNARFQALKANEGQIMEAQPQLQVTEFRNDRAFRVQSDAGYQFEHVDIQLGPQGHAALKQPYVRQALITGMNRPQIARALYAQFAPGLPTLQSLIFKTFEPGYQQNFGKWRFNQQRVIQILRGRNCTGGPARPSAGNNDIFSCPNVGRLSFRFSTTTGNQLRALTFEIIQRQLKSVGIELLPRFQIAGTLFGTTLPSGDWDLLMFTWVQNPASKIDSFDLYGTGADLNYMNYRNARLTNILRRLRAELDPARQRAMMQQADRILSNDLPSIPMFVRPKFLIHRTNVRGAVLNPTLEGSTWNANAWSVN